MAAPAIPLNFQVQQGNGQALASWSLVPGAQNYVVQRSSDGVNYSTLASPVSASYLDTTPLVGVQYYYQVASQNGSFISGFTNPQSCVPTNTGDLSLSQIRLMAKQRADLVNSPFITDPEWNTYINQSYFELYDLLVTVYEDYYVKTPYIFATTGTSFEYLLPSDFYKVLGVDLGLASDTNAWVTIKKFNFISRNRYVYPQLTSTYLGVFNLRYRVVGNYLYFIPTPSGGQYIRVWYVPKLIQLLQDTDILVGISGWSEYVIIDVAIKAMQKEESDVSILMEQKLMMKKRIEEAASNRDAGQPDTISDTRTSAERWGGYGGVGFDGSYGGFAWMLICIGSLIFS